MLFSGVGRLIYERKIDLLAASVLSFFLQSGF